MVNKRWYDSDPILKEALELLRLQPDNTQKEAAEFMLKLQEQVAAEVIDHVYEIINTYITILSAIIFINSYFIIMIIRIYTTFMLLSKTISFFFIISD